MITTRTSSRLESSFIISLRAFACWVLLGLCFLVLPFRAANAEDVPHYTLGPGDRVKVTVFGHDDLSGEFEIDGTGRISLPLIQQVAAIGVTAAELETTITDALKPDYLKNPRVSVEVLNYRPFYILGEVKLPGSYPYVNGMTVINAVALAGGYTYRARENKVAIIRATDAERAEQPANHDTAVLPGDVVMVPERFF